MISVKDIQNKYTKMYEYLRNYIWDFETVQHLADLEVAVYNAFPDIDDVRKHFNALYLDIRDVLKDDTDLKKHVEAFKEVISSDNNEFYFKLNQVKEVIQQ